MLFLFTLFPCNIVYAEDDYELELIEDEELRLKMSFEARKKAVNSYDSRIIASKILGTLKLLFP